MKHAIMLRNFQGKTAKVAIDDEIVDSLYLVLRYTISGDENYMFILDDGTFHIYDASDFVDEAPIRLISCGPEDMEVIFPEDMKWTSVYDA